jgi:ABC-2 type transport system permease protein
VIRLVAEREIRERLRGRAFRASSAVMLLGVLGIVAFAALQDDSGPTDATIAVADARQGRVARAAVAAQDAFGLRLEVEQSSPARAQRAVREGDADAALVRWGLAALSADAPEDLEPLLRAAWRQVQLRAALQKQGLSTTEVTAALSPPSLEVSRVNGEDAGGKALAYVGTLLLYVAILSFGYYVASGVVEEKSSRVIEIVVSSMRPGQLLAGKVVGIGLLGLAQLAVIGGVGVCVVLALGRLELPSATAQTVVMSLVYFVLGYAFYACGFAAAGAIVSRQEDLQSTTAPLTLLLVAAYLAALAVLNDPRSTFAHVTSFLPPVAPLTVPARIAQGAIGPWEVTLSVVCMVVGTLVLLSVAARMYEQSILRLGAPLRLSEALRLARRREGAVAVGNPPDGQRS